MPYITIKQPPKYYQMTFEDIMAGIDDLSKHVMPNVSGTRTYWVDYPNQRLLENTDTQRMLDVLKIFNHSKEALFAQDRASLYHTFHIPKSSGGLRRIDAPQPELMNALRELKTLFETHMFALYHTTAFAYVRGRSTIDALKRHQRNESKWFLKLDFADFFGSTTPTFVLDMLSRLFPFSELVKFPAGWEELEKALSLCFLNGGLPQGKIQQFVIDTLAEFNAPFTIKKEKTRYGSAAGRNWNLGLMLNNENQITIGHKRKKEFKAMLDNYMRGRQSGNPWDRHDIQVLGGLISYYRMVEKDYINYLLGQYSTKHGADVEKSIKADLAI